MKTKRKTTQKGITIIALVITIIVMLILASVTVAVTINGGLFGYAKKAKDEVEITEEKKVLSLAAIEAIGANRYGNLVQEEYQKIIEKMVNEQKITIVPGDNGLIVIFEESGRAYEVNGKGNVSNPNKIQKDESAGDITKGGECKGTEASPYKITCIEDLVEFSNLMNNSKISNYCYAILTKTLDFKSIFSYGDYKAKYSYDETKNAYIKDETSTTSLMELCTKDKGFIPINHPNDYRGTFDGQSFEILNLYINTSGLAGLFTGTMGGKICNLGISGSITSTENNAGGFVGTSQNMGFYDCYNKATITAKTYAGGIVGSQGNTGTIKNCYNEGIITGGNSTGGIVGRFAGKIDNCKNMNAVKSTGNSAGGILGQAANSTTITNCYNSGKVSILSGWQWVGGIAGHCYATITVQNCFNIGTIENLCTLDHLSYIYATSGIGGNTVTNCYNKGKLSSKNKSRLYEISPNTNESSYYFSNINENVADSASIIDVKDDTIENFVIKLNGYKDQSENYPSNWLTWKIGDKGYPVFEY